MTLRELQEGLNSFTDDAFNKAFDGNFMDMEILQIIFVALSVLGLICLIFFLCGLYLGYVLWRVEEIKTYEGNSKLYKIWLYSKLLISLIPFLFALIIFYVVFVLEK